MEISQYLVLASCSAMLIGMSKGGLPLVGMMSVPLLSLVMSPVKAAVLLLPLFVISDVVGVWLYRGNYSAINLKILVPAGLLGVLIGWLTASMISDLTIKLIIGLVGVSFCLQTWFKRG
ncbi:MAG: sulfite exporter TauE/SafE family protein, partial [Betaproteobacteria bacterium]|nr:sulfite exporter TauE/SafE family protein [Betaproteobacteria bacterium]